MRRHASRLGAADLRGLFLRANVAQASRPRNRMLWAYAPRPADREFIAPYNKLADRRDR